MLGIALPTLFALASAMPQADAEKPKHPAPLVPVAGQVEQPVELGQVKWRRDFEAGLAEAKRTGRPVLLLFQEVPGWQGCQDYGAQVLTHPLLVEAAEDLFVPIAIYNNTEGDADEQVRLRYQEPAWNYQVVRIVDAEGKDLTPRLEKDWTVAGVTESMAAGLRAAKKEVPVWLQLLAMESRAEQRGVESAVFGMSWFWVGEAEFGLVPGVTRTRQAWIGKEEVVEVWYDPKLLSFQKLLEHARTKDCARRVWTRTPAQAKLAQAALGDLVAAAPTSIRLDAEQKYYLLQTALAKLPLSEAQACRVNAQLEGEAFLRYLSPRQVKIAQRLIVAASKKN